MIDFGQIIQAWPITGPYQQSPVTASYGEGKEEAFGSCSAHQVLFLVSISNVLGAGSDVNDILEPTRQLCIGIGFAPGDKSPWLMVVTGGGLMEITTMVILREAMT